MSVAPGVLVAGALATAATFLAPFAPILGAPVIAILLGVALRSAVALPAALQPGITFCARTVLQAAIIVSGFSISLVSIYRTGLVTLPVMLGTIAVALLLAPIVGRLFGLEVKLRELVGIGTAICGASAIAAVASVIEPSDREIALAIATIFLYNIIAVLTFPLLGHVMGLSQAQFGVWAGTAINDTSSVVAAAFAYGHEAGVHATIVKLTRTLLILPIVGTMALWRAGGQSGAGKPVAWRTIVPWFIAWFLGAALLNTSGVIPSVWHTAIAQIAVFLISIALAAIGLQTALTTLLRAGYRPLVFGFVLWSAVAVASLLIQHFTGL